MLKNIGDFKSINGFVSNKLKKFEGMEKNFHSLYALMFSEENNIFYERTSNFKVIKYTYKEVKTMIEKKASYLSKLLLGANKGEYIGLAMNNSLDWIVCFWAIIRCGFNPFVINTRIAISALESTFANFKLKYIISDGRKYSVDTIMSSNILEGEEYLDEESFGDNFAIMSSGTSQNIKVCIYTAEEIFYQVKDCGQIIKDSNRIQRHYHGELKHLTFLPYYHVFGLVAMYFWFAFYSRTFVELKDMSSNTILETIRKHEVTHIFCVPLFWEKVYKGAIAKIKEKGDKIYKKFSKGLKISLTLGNSLLGKIFRKLAFKEVREQLFGESIRFLISGGGKLDRSVAEFFNGIGYHFTEGYGMTEVCITSVELSNRFKYLNSSSVGKPLSSLNYEIQDGELLVKGRGVAHQIFEGGKEINIKNTKFPTCDLACIKNGRYYINGRKDDLIISPSGENLNPNIIEGLFSFDNINGVCLVNGGNDRVMPTLIVSVEKFLKNDVVESIYNYIKKVLFDNGLSGEILSIVITTTPLLKEDDFKLNRRNVRQDYLNGKLSTININKESKFNSTLDDINNKVMGFFAEALQQPKDSISLAGNFFTDYGGNSLDYFSMICKIQDEFDVTIPSDKAVNLNSVEEISNYIKGNIK